MTISSPSTVVIRLTSNLGLLVGVLFFSAMMATNLIVIETVGCQDFDSKESLPFKRVRMLTSVAQVLTAVAALYQLVSNVSSSVLPIGPFLAVVQQYSLMGAFCFLLGNLDLIMGNEETWKMRLWLMWIIALCLICAKKSWAGEGEDQKQRTKAVAVASLVFGLAIGELTLDAILGMRFVVLVRVGCQEYLEHYHDYRLFTVAIVGLGGWLSAMALLKHVVSNLHQGGDNLPPSNHYVCRICRIFFLNAFFGYQYASMVSDWFMGLIGPYYATGMMVSLCLLYCLCRWEEKKWAESEDEDEDCDNNLEEPFLTLEEEEEEGGDSEDCCLLMTAVLV